MKKGIFLTFIIFVFFGVNAVYSQIELSKEELSDYTARAKNQIKVFLENVPVIASGSQSAAIRDAGVRTTLKIFSSKAYIEEMSKFSTNKKQYKPKKYLETLVTRSEKAPILINFEIIDDLTPDKMKKKTNKDGSIYYTGKMVFRQYYCKLRDSDELKEPVQGEPDFNCKYTDTTDKKVKFELSVMESKLGKYWVTKVSSIEVLRVF